MSGASEEVKRLIEKHLLKLNRKEEEAIRKVFFENKTKYAAAKELKISRHALQYRMEKGMEKMRRSIIEEIGEEEVERLLREM